MFRLDPPDQPRWLSISLPLLLLANVVLLAAVLGVFGPDPLSGWSGTPREPARLRQQVRTERMELQPAQPNRPASGAVPEPQARGAGPAGKVLAAATKRVAVAASEDQCVEIGGFSAQAVRRAAEDLSGGSWQVEQFERREQVRWWIHLPAQPTRENLERKLAELRRRNVTDYSVVTSGSAEAESFTVSLGLFRERERAEHYMETLRGQGVRTAVLADAPHPFTRQWLRVRGADDAARARLNDMRQRYGAETLLACGAA
ncbi:SPOR domain-containing protein [Cupriavidus necator]|uniref:Putative signal peptide protein n=1 Tax=Cupriavidus pinatubonensis (strain JMP 134 / LMG 1197) TaxID=264198 RepID=Q477E7_CUPPJ|nr:SPOR domain-containing protein [Cupriavidus necator]